MKKGIIIIGILFIYTFVLPQELIAATMERIPSAADLPYFKVMKREGNTLYGIRITPISENKTEAAKNDEAKIERIPGPSDLPYFRVVRREGNTLYGIRIAKAPVKTESNQAAVTKNDEALIERIPSPSDLPYFRVVRREGNTLYGIRIANIEHSKIIDGKLRMIKGVASWYRFKNGLFAASPDYPKGSVLKVTNVSNNKTVEVIVNDFGPDRKVHPDRVIDLDYEAFKAIASPGAGLINVLVEPLSIFGSNFNKEKTSVNSELELASLAAIVVRESDGEVIFKKNSNQVLPIASLTKLVFAKVFLDLKIDFDKVVDYKYQDEKYNYEFCEPWESARLRVAENDTLTIKDLFYSSIIGSANNTVETLVRHSGLSRADFINKMNIYVKSLGANNTKFVEPTGLSSENVSSPDDYAIIAKEVLADKKLKLISSETNYSFSTINTNKAFNLKNTNHLLKSNTYNISGSKTGYLHEAGYCLITQIESEGESFIIINLNSKTRDLSFADNEKLIKFSLKK